MVVSLERVWEQSPTYNLEVEGSHTFFADGVLVHNAKAGYTYSASTTDPDGDNISYLFDWGDGSDSGWRGPYTSGATAFATHLWSSPGTYQVRVKASDEQGAVSGWSSSLTVYVNQPPVADFTWSPPDSTPVSCPPCCASHPKTQRINGGADFTAMKAVIPAAGLGTRFLPATKSTPKEMLPVVDKPAIQYVVEEAVEAGIDDILIITGRGKQSIEDYFDMSYELESVLHQRNDYDTLEQLERISDLADIHYIRQKSPLGLGHAVLCAKKHVDDDDFAVLLGDDIIISETPCIGQLVDQFRAREAPVVAVGEVPREAVVRYGIVDGEPVGERLYRVRGMVEKPPVEEAPSTLAVMGRYVFTPEIFGFIEEVEPGRGGEIQLTDAISAYNRHHQVYAYRFDGRRFDLGNKLDWIKTNIELALTRDEYREQLLEFMRGKTSS